ncbi:MAG TPA: helix-turn-helix domain-containing protein [Candidatus Acidoferrales bacterium]
MAAQTFIFRWFAPHRALRPYIHCYGLFASFHPENDRPPRLLPGEESHQFFHPGDPLADRVIPSGYVVVTFNLGDAFGFQDALGTEWLKQPGYAIGPTKRASRFLFGRSTQQLGVMFHPGRAGAFFDCPVEVLTGRILPLGDVWGAAGRDLERRLQELPALELRLERIERELLHRLRRGPALDERFASIATLIHSSRGAIGVESLSESSGLSRQHLTRKFRRQFGIGPKQYCRVARFEALMTHVYSHMLPGSGWANPAVPKFGLQDSWAGVAAEFGYYDQAHLISEFKEFTGLTPTQFFAPRPI